MDDGDCMYHVYNVSDNHHAMCGLITKVNTNKYERDHLVAKDVSTLKSSERSGREVSFQVSIRR